MSTLGARINKTMGRAVLAVTLLLAASGVAQAGPLNLVLGLPDIASAFMTVAYNNATDTFTAVSSSMTYKPGNTPIGGTAPSYSLTAHVDQNQNLLGGSLSITGSYGPVANGTLLAGDLTRFGYNAATGVFEFGVNVTSDPLGWGTGPAEDAGIVLASGLKNFDFNSDATRGPGTGNFSVSADTAHVPEPASLGLFALGALGVMLARRRRGQAAQPPQARVVNS